MTTATLPQTSSLDQYNAVATDYLGRLLECHNGGQSENDIRTAFRDFIIRTGIIADEREVKTEVPPATDNAGRVDMYVRNTYIEFKRDLEVRSVIDPGYIRQLDDYLLASVKDGWGIQNGILTDGKRYLKRNIGDGGRPPDRNRLRTFDQSDQGPRLREYLNDIIDTEARDITPSPEMLTKHLGIDSDLLKSATALLQDAHHANRDNPTIAVKRKLWQDLLEVALGQNSTGDPDTADWLYIRHTYLTSLLAIILQAHFGIDVVHESDANPEALLNGSTLNAYTNLKGVIESDLFQWPAELGAAQYIRAIARKVAQFNWQERPDEMAAVLYQNTITPEERRKMGEYYTPKWLAQAIVDDLVTNPADTVTMDPSCGSGTFIECLAENIIAASAGQHPADTLERLQKNIIGVDLHPVAVQLAKATWVLNCREIINAARTSDRPPADIAPPIYLGDSLQLRYDDRALFNRQTIRLRTTEPDPDAVGNGPSSIYFEIPLSLARQADRFDLLMLDLAQAIDRNADTDRVLDNHGVSSGPELDTIQQTVAQMRKLHAVNRNHIWAYYLRNMVRPAVIAEHPVDAIVGNPPWLTYSRSADIVREELVNLCRNAYGIWAGGRLAPHQDVSTLFFARVADLYLKDGGHIAMVLPHSALRSGQHAKWRSGYWQSQDKDNLNAVSVDFHCKVPWDLDNLEPNDFFPMPSSVVFARSRGKNGDYKKQRKLAQPLAPGRVEIWRGPTNTPQVTRLPEPLHHDDGQFHSPYADIAMQGPTIVDRRLFFVTKEPNPAMLAAPGTFITFPRETKQDKKQYDVSALRGNILHDDNLFAVYPGETIAPYIALPPLTAALPVSKATLTMPLDHSRCPKNPRTGRVTHNACAVDTEALDARMQLRWPTMESLWDANKGKSDTKSLVQRLNFNRSLTSQLEYLNDPADRPVRIAYASAGRPTAALITDPKAILDYRTFQVACRNLDEAHYLLAVINSIMLEQQVAQFRPKGLFGERDLQKHLWKLPIPAFDAGIANHAELASLGQRAVAEASAIVAAITEVTVTKARSAMRHQWQPTSPTAQAIENAVAQLLGGAAQAPAPDRATFERLADEWEQVTQFVSNIQPFLEHPAYRQIISMGPAAVPWLLARLDEGRPPHWFAALFELTGANPVPPESRGRIREMTAAWQEWGRQQGYGW